MYDRRDSQTLALATAILEERLQLPFEVRRQGRAGELAGHPDGELVALQVRDAGGADA